MKLQSYGYLNKQQAECLIKYVNGKVVYDLGSGNLKLSNELITLGAAKVISIDKKYIGGRANNFYQSGVEIRASFFQDIDEDIDTAFVSWPANYDNGLLKILKRTKTILYLGKNTDGVACGTPDLFKYLITRKVNIHIPSKRNTLICYSDELVENRYLLDEEAAAINVLQSIKYKNPRCQKLLCYNESYEHPEMGILCVCQEHYEAIERGEASVPPIRKNIDYCSVGRKTFLVTDPMIEDLNKNNSENKPTLSIEHRDSLISKAINSLPNFRRNY